MATPSKANAASSRSGPRFHGRLGSRFRGPALVAGSATAAEEGGACEVSDRITFRREVPIVIWGLRWTKDSFRFIHSGWYWTLKREGFHVTWVEDRARNAAAVSPGAIVLCVNVASRHLPRVEGARYVGHNLPESQCTALEDSGGRVARLQVWTNEVPVPDASKEVPCVSFDAQTRTLYQPWGTPFAVRTWRTTPAEPSTSTEYWIGSIWNDAAGQGNRPVMENWRSVLHERNLTFRKVPPGWPDRLSPYAALIRRSRLGSSVVGDWQRTHEYLPCRVFKNTSAGVPPSGNNPAYSRVFGDAAIVDDDLARLADRILSERAADRRERLAEAQQRMRPYTYERSLQRILDLAGQT